MHSAVIASATIMMMRRGNRSASVPPSGPNTACGNRPITPAIASAEAEPVVSVIHHNSTNCVSALPMSDSACPTQMAKKRGFQLSVEFTPVASTAIVFVATSPTIHISRHIGHPYSSLFIGLYLRVKPIGCTTNIKTHVLSQLPFVTEPAESSSACHSAAA